MFILDLIADRKIAESIANGELSHLPGEGRPLDLQQDALIPEDLRVVYRILGNAGFVPPEVETLRRIGELERLVEALSEGEPRSRALKKLQLLRTRLEISGKRPGALRPGERYTERVVDRLAKSASGS